MPVDRTAIDTITGYYYQFDYFILRLLQSSDPQAEVCIEAIEDVDINTADETTAVQCKYYVKSEYQHSVIKKPIRLMLDHFAANPATRGRLNYSLYGHYKSGQEKFPKELTLNFLKDTLLTYTEKGVSHVHHQELKLSDAELQLFLDHLKIDVNAPEFHAQEVLILSELKKHFHCTDAEAEFYYSNALRVVRELSTKQAMEDRTITAGEFLGLIDNNALLFDAWYLRLRGADAYCKTVKRLHFTERNISPHARFFLIDCDGQTGVQELKTIILSICKKWSRLSKYESAPFCPYVLLHGAPAATIVAVKRAIHLDGVGLIDGYAFNGADFDPDTITQQPTYANGIKLKFITELSQLDQVLRACRKETRIVYQFCLNAPYYQPDRANWVVRNILINETKQIENMI